MVEKLCLGGENLFCVACEVSDDKITAEICWARFPLPDEVIIWEPKKPDPVYRVKIPDDLCSLHTEVEFQRVRKETVQRRRYSA